MHLSIKDNAPNIVFRPSRRLYNIVLGAFRAQGTSFAKWCERQDISRENARAALHGVWRGPKADIVLARIVAGADQEVISYLMSRPQSKAGDCPSDIPRPADLPFPPPSEATHD